MTGNNRFILKENGVIDDTQLNILLDGGEDKEDMVDLLNDLNDDNEQLKQRNKRQYNQLTEVWSLIEAKDWETLTEMDNQMKEEDERLQRMGG